jgi:hypothetical protein
MRLGMPKMEKKVLQIHDLSFPVFNWANDKIGVIPHVVIAIGRIAEPDLSSHFHGWK